MHTKTMEGLIGARTNMELLNTPFRVFKEARLKGDTAKMEQAMGYVNDFEKEAYKCKDVADEGMKKDAEETRRIAREQQEEAIRKRREEREEFEKKIEEKRNADNNTDANINANTNMDTKETNGYILEISEEGKRFAKDNTNTDTMGAGTDTIKNDTAKEPVTYTKEGAEVSMEQEPSISVSV